MKPADINVVRTSVFVQSRLSEITNRTETEFMMQKGHVCICYSTVYGGRLNVVMFT